MEDSDYIYRCLCGREMIVEQFHRGRLVQCPMCRCFVLVPLEEGELAKPPHFKIQTERLRLRLAESRDWRAVHAFQSDQRNYQYEISPPSSETDTKKFLKRSKFPRGFKRSNSLVFVVNDVAGNVLGLVSVSFDYPYCIASLGFMFSFENQGKGYGTESVRAVCQWLMTVLHVEKIRAMCDAENTVCRSVLEKVGFRSEGLLRKFFYHPERGWLDSPMYALFREV